MAVKRTLMNQVGITVLGINPNRVISGNIEEGYRVVNECDIFFQYKDYTHTCDIMTIGELYTSCGSGSQSATEGFVNLPYQHFGPIPKDASWCGAFGVERLEEDKYRLSIGTKVLGEISEYLGDPFYPAGYFNINEDVWKQPRACTKPKIYLIHGDSGLGKSWLTAYLKFYVFETDSMSHDVLSQYKHELLISSVIVIGNRRPDTVNFDTVYSELKYQLSTYKIEADIIEVPFLLK